MKHFIFIVFLFSNIAFADYLYEPSNICIKKYWYANGTFYYIRSDNGATISVTTQNLGDYIFPDYDYNVSSGECALTPSNNSLGLSNEDFNYLNALLGVMIFGLVIIGFFL